MSRSEESAALAKMTNASRMLAEVRDARGAKKVADLAAAAEFYAKKVGLAEESIGYAHAIKVDAQTLLGRFLAQTPKNKGAQAGGHKAGPRGAYVEPRDATPTIAELGLTKKESALSQTLARIADEAPEVHAAVRENKTPVTAAVREFKKRDGNGAPPKPPKARASKDVVWNGALAAGRIDGAISALVDEWPAGQPTLALEDVLRQWIDYLRQRRSA